MIGSFAPLGLGIGVGRARWRGGAANPFAAPRPGFVFDMSDMSLQWQDAHGTVPVTGVEQPVGLVLDKSAISAAQLARLKSGATLSDALVDQPDLVSNGSFASNLSGWTVGTDAAQVIPTWVAPGRVSLTRGAGSLDGFSQVISGVVAQKAYLVELDLVSATAGSITVALGGGALVGVTTPGRVRFVIVAGGALLRLWPQSSNATVVIDNISVKEIPGIVAQQATTSKRPQRACWPLGGRRNLLGYTEDFGNAAWLRSACSVSSGAAVSLAGSTYLPSIIVEDATSGLHQVQSQNVAATTGEPVTISVIARALGSRWLHINAQALVGARGVFELSGLGRCESGGTASNRTATITPLGDGYYLCAITGTFSGASSAIFFQINNSYIPADVTYSGDGASGCILMAAQLEIGSSRTAYQRVVSSANVTEAGVKTLTGLLFDGVDDALATNSVDLTSTDKIKVFAGARKMSDAGRAVVCELGAGGTYSFALNGPVASAGNNYAAMSGGSLPWPAASSPSIYPAPHSAVLTGSCDISGDRIELRVNGSRVAQSGGDQGSGNYQSAALHIGSRSGTSLYFTGYLTALVVRPCDNSEIPAMEAVINDLTGAY